MILSDKNLRERLIEGTQEIEQAKKWWEAGEWGKTGNRIVIDPFKPHALGACCYDLSVGDEYVSLRDPYSTKRLQEDEHINVGPGETVLILTREYICLPRNMMAIIVPRATWIFEGTSICATRIEPTWFGKLVVAFTNLAKYPIALGWGEGFCTCYWMEVAEVERALTKEVTPHLGRTKIGTIKFAHARPQPLVAPEAVTRQHLENTAEAYGTPWDIVQGAFVLTQKELRDWIEKEVAPDIAVEATTEAEKRAFTELLKWHRILIGGGLTLFAAFLGLLGYLIYLVSSSP